LAGTAAHWAALGGEPEPAPRATRAQSQTCSEGLWMEVAWLLLMLAALVGVSAVLGLGAEHLIARIERQVARPGWWAPPRERARLSQILARNPSYDEQTGLTSDRELARWYRENQP
jgi:hypothetical protein